MEEYTNRELGILLKNLHEKLDTFSDKVEKDFKGVHERQDRTNGNVKKNTQYRLIGKGVLVAMNALYLPVAYIVLKKFIDGLW